MNLIDSMEMRWFLPAGDAAIAVLRERFADVPIVGDRSDRYLIEARPDLGIKVRGEGASSAMLETKLLLGTLGSLEVAPSIQGRVEQWRKVSAELARPPAGEDGAWLEVRKDRQLRKLAFDGERVTPVATTERPLSGCNIELTKLAFVPPPHEAWTFGLEAFGPAAGLFAILSATVGVFAAERPGLVLDARHSMSYATWIRAVSSQSRRPLANGLATTAS